MGEAHKDPRFVHAATYAVTITYTVAGGARPDTVHRRAGKVAERLANAAARAADVVDVMATVGPVGVDDEVLAPSPVRFTAANTGTGTDSQPDKLARYLDPDHERARASLAEAYARDRAHRQADQRRRAAVACLNQGFSRLRWHFCRCVYCDPAIHLAGAGQEPGPWGEPPQCLCGRAVDVAGGRCRDHRDVQLVVLDGDPPSLVELAHVASSLREGDR